jgi:hypothetical protein
MTQLHSSRTPLARAYPLIVESIEGFERYATGAQQRSMDDDNVIVVISQSAGQMIRRFTLDSTYN